MTFATSKRVLAVLLLLCMVFGLLPAVAFADSDLAEEPAAVETEAETAEEAAEPVEEAEAANAESLEVAEPAEPAEEPAPAEEAAVALAPMDAPQVEADAASVAGTVSPMAIRYTITYNYFNAAGASVATKTSKSHASGTSVRLSEGVKDLNPTDTSGDGTYYTHYEIVSWNTMKDGSGTSYAVNDTLTMPSSSFQLYAFFEESEQKHWDVSIEGNGSLKHLPFVKSPDITDYRYVRVGETFKIFVKDSGDFLTECLQTIFPEPEEGYVFDGWYLNGETKIELIDFTPDNLKNLNIKLTDDDYAAGRNKILARFVADNGNWAHVKYQESEGGYVYYEQNLDKGSATPSIPDPAYTKHYFIDWEPAVSETVTGDVVYTAKWLPSPDYDNAIDCSHLFTIRCSSGAGHDGKSHKDMVFTAYGSSYCKPNDDVAYDEARGVYTCSITILPAVLNLGSNCYDYFSGELHTLAEDAPKVNLIWNEEKSLWEPDGQQFVYAVHQSGDEEIREEDLKKLTKVICATDGSNYQSLPLIEGTYEIVYTQKTGETRTAKIHINNFDPYASMFGSAYEPDWEANLHEEADYVYYMTRSYEKHGYGTNIYNAWSDWKLDNISTYDTVPSGVLHPELTNGKELRVKMTPVICDTISLNLGGTIGLNFKMRLPDYVLADRNARAVLTYKDKDTVVDFHSMQPDGDGRYVFTYRVPAKELANPIGLKFVSGKDTFPMVRSNGDPVPDGLRSYSCLEYCQDPHLSEKGKLTAQALQNYCAYAYIYFKDTEDVKPELVGTPDLDSVTAETLDQFKSIKSGGVDGLNYEIMSLSLKSTTEINLKFSLAADHSIGEYSFTMDGADVTPTLKGQYYVLTIPNISGKNLDTRHTVQVTRGEQSFSVSVTALSYAYSALSLNQPDKTDRDNTCKALYLYNQAVHAYFD